MIPRNFSVRNKAQGASRALVSNVGGPKKQNCLHLAAARTTKSLVYKNKCSTSLDFPVS